MNFADEMYQLATDNNKKLADKQRIKVKDKIRDAANKGEMSAVVPYDLSSTLIDELREEGFYVNEHIRRISWHDPEWNRIKHSLDKELIPKKYKKG